MTFTPIDLELRRQALKMPVECLAKRSKLPLERVDYALKNKSSEEDYEAVAAALGLFPFVSVEDFLQDQLLEKALFVLNLVQGEMALEGQALPEEDISGYLEYVSELISEGPPGQIWS